MSEQTPSSHVFVEPNLVSASEIVPEKLAWLWPGRIPLGKITLLFGDPGLGKSLVTVDLASRVSRGAAWPDEVGGVPRQSGEERKPGRVVMLSAEDDPADTIVPRLRAARADLTKVELMNGVRSTDGKTRFFDMGEDLCVLKLALDMLGDVRLVIVDPLSAYLGQTDTHKNADVRGLLAPLAELAAKYRVAVLCVTHLNKAQGGRALYRATGSLAFVAAARAAWVVCEDQTDKGRRLMLPAKMNLAKDTTGMAFSVVSVPAEEVGAVAWEPVPVDMTADEAMDGSGVKEKVTGAIEWLKAVLKDGPLLSGEVEEEAEKWGFSKATLRRAKEKAGVKSRKRKFGEKGEWEWYLDA